ncbi:MAG: protein kinase [Planctomyces sp.]|nr:protein kinase [Planctomyces sp.]
MTASNAEDTLRQDVSDQARSSRLSRLPEALPGKTPGYEVQRCLGEGSFGSVWLATETRTGRQVAIKFYTHRKGLDWSLLSREVEKLAVLYTSRNIVGLLDVGWDHEPPYFVMEYLEQGALSARLSDGALPVDDAVRIAREILHALIHAHNSGILHCDVKPANVLIDSGGSSRLGDFGQSRLTTEQSPALGTLYYMGPEQAVLDGTPDARWDVYALGALLYHMLTGSPPYRTAGNEARLRAAGALEERLEAYRGILAASPRPDAHRRRHGVDPALAQIVDGCLERDPQLRIPNAQVVLDLLDERDKSLAKRPLMILGVVGPILFLLTLLTVAAIAVPKAVATAERNLTDRALATDVVAAKILAASVQQEFDVRQKELEDVADSLVPGDEADSGELRPDLQAFLDGWHATAAQRLEEQNRTADESIFVANAVGFQVYRQPRDATIGGDFAWRDYFHGQGRELPRGTRAQPRTAPGISRAYRSSSSRQYKVAVSVPIWNRDRTRVVGVLARTINLNDLLNQWEARIRARDDAGPALPSDAVRDRFLALADLRDTPAHLLDHPWMSEQDSEELEDEQLKNRLQLTDEQTHLLRTRDRDAHYVDPLADQDPRFRGPWLAAFSPVGTSGWVAIVQELRAVAVEPVNELRNVFLRYGVLALLAFIAVFALLWMLIRRAAR